MTARNRLPAVIAALLGGGLCAIGTAHAASVDRPGPDSCMVDVTPSDDEAPMSLQVKFTCAVNGPFALRANNTLAASFVTEFTDRGGRTIQPDGRLWRVSVDGSGMAEATYRFELDAFLDQTNSDRIGMRRGGTRALLLEGWLMQPLGRDRPLKLAIAVKLPAGQRFASGLRRRAGRYVLDDTPVRFAGYSVFGSFEPTRVAVPSPPSDSGVPAHIDLVFLDADYTARREQYGAWVQQSARAIATYFDGFSSLQTLIVVFPVRGTDIEFGRVVPGGGVTMMLRAGIGEKARDLYGEWVLIHEMIHTAAPFVEGRGTWLMEGMATYIEPIIRSRVGWKSEDDVWREWLTNMPRGVGALAESGLSANSSHAGYYWGGALFLLLTDIEMRRASDNRYGLEDCLRAILRDGGNAAARTTVPDMIAACDKAVGGTTMRDMAQRYVYRATPVDLMALWRSLGVELVDGKVVYRDDAPLAAIRKVIVRGVRPPVLVPMGPA